MLHVEPARPVTGTWLVLLIDELELERRALAAQHSDEFWRSGQDGEEDVLTLRGELSSSGEVAAKGYKGTQCSAIVVQHHFRGAMDGGSGSGGRSRATGSRGGVGAIGRSGGSGVGGFGGRPSGGLSGGVGGGGGGGCLGFGGGCWGSAGARGRSGGAALRSGQGRRRPKKGASFAARAPSSHPLPESRLRLKSFPSTIHRLSHAFVFIPPFFLKKI